MISTWHSQVITYFKHTMDSFIMKPSLKLIPSQSYTSSQHKIKYFHVNYRRNEGKNCTTGGQRFINFFETDGSLLPSSICLQFCNEFGGTSIKHLTSISSFSLKTKSSLPFQFRDYTVIVTCFNF